MQCKGINVLYISHQVHWICIIMPALHYFTNHRRRYSGLVLVHWCVHGQNLLNLRKLKQLSQLVVINEHCRGFSTSFGLTSSPRMNCSVERVQHPSEKKVGVGSAMYFECHTSIVCPQSSSMDSRRQTKEASTRKVGGEP